MLLSLIFNFNFICRMKDGVKNLMKEMKVSAERGDLDEESGDGKCVILDVGGDRFVASRKHLERFPATR